MSAKIEATKRASQSPLPSVAAVKKSSLCDPECEICHGSGYVRNDLPVDHPLFGQIELCPNVDRWNLPYSKRYGVLRSEADRLRWSILLPDESVANAAKAIQKVTKRGYGWVYVYGGPGLAKTLLLKIAVSEWLRSGKEACYTRVADIMDHLRAAYDQESASIIMEERLNWWAEVPLLAIDEFHRMRSTEFAEERRFMLLDRRYEDASWKKKGITIMASIGAPSELPADLADRVYDGRFEIVRIEGESLRPGMNYGLLE